MDKWEVEKLIRNCLPTYNNVGCKWDGDNTVYVTYPYPNPSSKEYVELRIAKPGNTTKWMLYACSENFTDGNWELIQQRLLARQQ